VKIPACSLIYHDCLDCVCVQISGSCRCLVFGNLVIGGSFDWTLEHKVMKRCDQCACIYVHIYGSLLDTQQVRYIKESFQ
jgi:hypothetical protein